MRLFLALVAVLAVTSFFTVPALAGDKTDPSSDLSVTQTPTKSNSSSKAGGSSQGTSGGSKSGGSSQGASGGSKAGSNSAGGSKAGGSSAGGSKAGGSSKGAGASGGSKGTGVTRDGMDRNHKDNKTGSGGAAGSGGKKGDNAPAGESSR